MKSYFLRIKYEKEINIYCWTNVGWKNKIRCRSVSYTHLDVYKRQDIGTDHGIIPMMLSKNCISKKIIATDISKNSLEKLEKKLILNDNITNIETRVSDGLDCLDERCV